MSGTEKVDFYDQHKPIIHEAIKTESQTKPLWRKLYWTTAKDSYAYKYLSSPEVTGLSSYTIKSKNFDEGEVLDFADNFTTGIPLRAYHRRLLPGQVQVKCPVIAEPGPS